MLMTPMRLPLTSLRGLRMLVVFSLSSRASLMLRVTRVTSMRKLSSKAALSVAKLMLMFTGTTIQDQTWFVNSFFQKNRSLITNHLQLCGHKAQAVGAWVELNDYRTLVMATIRPVRDCIRLAYLVAISSVSNIVPRLNHTLYRL